jgi:uncharacterized damage-inducible protein DinB
MDRGLIEFLRYSAWANRTVLDACRPVSPEQLQSAVPPTSESIAELLLHTAGAEENTAHWVRGEDFETAMDRATPWPGLDEVARRLADTSGRLIGAAESLDPEGEVDLQHHGAKHRYSTRFLLVTVVEHGFRHRTEVVRMLSTLALPPPDLDGWAYGRTVGQGHVVE